MHTPLILASGSEIRARLLRGAGLSPQVISPRIDEEAIRTALLAEGASPRDLADLLAEMKTRKLSERHPGALVLGADQVLDCDGQIFSKPTSPDDAAAQLARLSGRSHRLLSALVVSQDGKPVWRHIGEARLTMHPIPEPERTAYLLRNWPDIRHCVGCYKLEEEGARLFSRIEGDYFTILGLPLIEFLSWLRFRGDFA
ncbi:septum formation protein Maf [Rhodobacter veldkampii DSM 11550]|uniref:Nucleoside triphosphate pyrophosphatase n=1 Tax=Phaeovulum veldkampii DSM 11550 TaxID=1185920 RepID=A0A2T4JJ36_9RHOB|nr:nucleoside triphosphate pyrophosphatase [Phaeovulum veldkampii]MBK5947278.1 septum formation protein Maf [Phaeovulum veldkampii DSM 11550]PTE17931.1 septum formation protein Maf [Phaeovulum veldkampii DSM 11550]TDQ56716.1 septum formation protein [Phaeovulum veldkampii DSM 11550]